MEERIACCGRQKDLIVEVNAKYSSKFRGKALAPHDGQ